MVQPIPESLQPAHVVVVASEKGGSGKSTAAVHITVALLKAGQRVASVDLDGRQKTFTHYIQNRRAWCERRGMQLELPTHYCIERAQTSSIESNERIEVASLCSAINMIERTHDFVVVDTPGNDTFLMRLAHSMADTLITPINDSFVDFDVLGNFDPINLTVTGESHYAKMVREARRERRLLDGRSTDWIVIRNRLSGSRNNRHIADGLTELGKRMAFRWSEGFAERVVYREFFPLGLTALDDPDSAPGHPTSKSRLKAREEVINLLTALQLPLSENDKRHAAILPQWNSAKDELLQVHEMVD